MGTRETPPVSGSSLEGAGVALEVGLAEAIALPVVAEAEALVVALVEAEALEMGLAVASSSIPDRRSHGRLYLDRLRPGRPYPYRQRPCRLTGPLRRVRRPTRPTPPTRLAIRIYARSLLVFACTFTVRMHHAKPLALYKFMGLSRLRGRRGRSGGDLSRVALRMYGGKIRAWFGGANGNKGGSVGARSRFRKSLTEESRVLSDSSNGYGSVLVAAVLAALVVVWAATNLLSGGRASRCWSRTKRWVGRRRPRPSLVCSPPSCSDCSWLMPWGGVPAGWRGVGGPGTGTPRVWV